MQLEFEAAVFFWKGPAPWYFVAVPEPEAAELEAASAFVTYGWGMIPVTAYVGETRFATSLWPRDGGYVVPLKAAVRRAEGIEVEDTIRVRLVLDL